MCWEHLTRDDETVEREEVRLDEDLDRPDVRAETPEEPAERELVSA